MFDIFGGSKPKKTVGGRGDILKMRPELPDSLKPQLPDSALCDNELSAYSARAITDGVRDGELNRTMSAIYDAIHKTASSGRRSIELPVPYLQQFEVRRILTSKGYEVSETDINNKLKIKWT